jgi:hypothetical protein
MPKFKSETGILSLGWFLDVPVADVQQRASYAWAAESLAMADPRWSRSCSARRISLHFVRFGLVPSDDVLNRLSTVVKSVLSL